MGADLNEALDDESSRGMIRILHVEDSEIDALTVKTMLHSRQGAAMGIVRAGTLAEARTLLGAGGFDLVLLDLNLPDSKGLSTVRALLAETDGSPLIIALTGEDYDETGLGVLKEGAQDFLPKAALSADALRRSILNALERKRLERALSWERRRAEEYLDIAPVIIVVQDAEGRIVRINRAGCEALGGRAADFLGASWLEEFVPGEERPTARRAFERLLRGENLQYERMEYRIRGMDGQERLIAWKHAPLRDAAGNVEGVLGSGLDVTAKRRNETRILVLSRLTEDNPNPLLRVDGEGRIVYGNPASASFLSRCGLSIGGRAPEDLLRAIAKVRASGEIQEIRFEAAERVFRFTLAEALDAGLVNVFGQDVTESDDALKRLTQSEQTHRVIFENSPLGMIHSDASGRVTKCNSRFLEIMGTTPGKIIGFNALTGLQNQKLRKAVETAINGEPAGFEGRYESITGTRSLYLRAHFSPVRAAEPPSDVIGVFEDYTESRKAEERMRFIQQRLELALEASGIGMWDWFMKNGLYEFDERWSRMLGYAPDELERTEAAWRSLIHPGDEPAVQALLQSLDSGKTSAYQAECRMRTKSGAWKWTLSLGKVMERDEDGKPSRMTGIHLDIDDHMRLMEERDWGTRVKEVLSRLYRRLTVSTPDMEDASRFLLSETRPLVGASLGFCASMTPKDGGLMVQAYSGALNETCALVQGKLQMTDQRAKGSYPGLWGRALNTGQAFFTNTPASHPASTGLPEGHAPIANFLAVPAILGNRPAGIIALANKEGGFTARDLAAVKEIGRYYAVAIQRVEALKELSESEERYRTLVESMQEGIIMIDDAGRLTYVNHQICKMLGRSRQDLLGRPMIDFVDESKKRDYQAQLDRRREGDAGKYEMTFAHAQGHRIFTLISPSPLFDDEGRYKGAFGVVTNVTQLKLLESQLVQAQKLESIGQLAAGIAHEINTPTQYVDNNVRYVRDGVDKLLAVAKACRGLVDAVKAGEGGADEAAALEALLDEADVDFLAEEAPAALDDSLDGLSRIAEIVRSVKQLAHPGKPEMELADINEALKSTVTVSRNEWKYAADLTLSCDETLPLVRCVRGEFNQVILNLIVNAAQSIQEKIGAHPEEKGRIAISSKNVGDGVEIRVSDTGMGIPARIRDKIFDPFFTTKEVGKGTGQGLAISHNVIREKHRGRISFESEEGEGATFIVWLPFGEDHPGNDSGQGEEA